MSQSLPPDRPILIVDDEPTILNAIETTLNMAGFDGTQTCADSRQVMELMAPGDMEAVLLDLNMPHIDGQRLLDAIREEHPDIPVIIVTGAVDVETAVACTRAGAFDYIVKPVEADRLVTAVRRALSFQELRRENLSLKDHILDDRLQHPDAFAAIITANAKMLNTFQYIESIAGTSQPVLVRGETGVGKELAARAIHRLSGLAGRFVAVNAAGLDDNVFSDTLFGHVRGAFTGAETQREGLIEKAAGGTLFLDEIGDLSVASQVKLLRLLQEEEYYPLGSDERRSASVRIVAATNQDLDDLQRQGRFRKDLHYRLHIHRIYLPPLRERLDDLPLLVPHFMKKSARRLDRKPPPLPENTMELLRSYAFPGNIRELESMIFDAVSRHRTGVMSLEAFKSHITHSHAATSSTAEASPVDDQLITFADRLPTIRQATRLLVNEAMLRSGGNQSLAARILGISQQALSKRLKKMSSPEERP